jgi:hypothetical protein
MRDYPPPAEYEKMLSSAPGIRIAFKDKSFQGAEIEKTPLGLPRARAGAFAVVYRAFMLDRSSCAVRLFLKDGDDRQDRYRHVSEHLSRQKLPCLVPFTYEADSFRAADGQWYPMMTMEWVKGETLFDWLQARAGAGDTRAINAVTEQWKTTIKDLNRAQIAHGDLQHANVMITDSGEIKLVDYDGMCVPKLVGRKNLEIGVEPYQHPTRDGNTQLSLSLDNFSSVFIYVGLRALSADPRLWHDFVVKTDYDKMLFRKEDFSDPRNSPLIQRLRKSPDGDVQRLATSLVELAHLPIDKVPFLDELLFSFDQVRVLLDQRDFDGAVEVLTRNQKRVGDAPSDLQPRITEAQNRVAKLAELQAAVSGGNEQGMAALVSSPLLHGYPKAGDALAAAADAPAVVQALERLRAAKAAARWRDFVREWDSAQAVLKRPKGSLRKSAGAYATEVDSWRNRNGLCDAILSLLRSPEPDADALATAWKRLTGLGGHPECDSQRRAVEAVVNRAKAWRAFCKVGRGLDEATDKALVAAWSDAAFHGWPTAEMERSRVDQASARLRQFEAVTKAAAGRFTAASEEQLIRSAASLPSAYSTALDARVHIARQRIQALASLATALAVDSESAIVAGNRLLESLQAAVLIESSQQARVVLAVKRDAVLERLRKIPANYPTPQAVQWDGKILAAWDEGLLRNCKDAAAWIPAFEAAIRRKKLLAELDSAVARGDAFRAHDITSAACLKDYPFVPDVSRFLARAASDVTAVRGMQAAITTGDCEAFSRAFSARILREHAATFAGQWPTLLEWTRSHVLPPARLGLAPPVGVRAVEVKPSGTDGLVRCVLRWKWPDPRFTDECRVLICRNRPANAATPETVTAVLKIPKTRELYQSGGGYHAQQLDVATKGCYAVVWARIDLGSESLWSEPLVLGKV